MNGYMGLLVDLESQAFLGKVDRHPAGVPNRVVTGWMHEVAVWIYVIGNVDITRRINAYRSHAYRQTYKVHAWTACRPHAAWQMYGCTDARWKKYIKSSRASGLQRA